MTSQLLETIKDWSPVGTLVTALVGVGTLMTGFWKDHRDRIAALKERRKELLWKQINTAKELLSDIHSHDQEKSAVHMLDWCHGSGMYDCVPVSAWKLLMAR